MTKDLPTPPLPLTIPITFVIFEFAFAGTHEYAASKKEAFKAFATYPNGLQVGGGINDKNAKDFIEAGASHVIVTSYLFEDDELSIEKMEALVKAVGKEHVVIDLSCKKINDKYFFLML